MGGHYDDLATSLVPRKAVALVAIAKASALCHFRKRRSLSDFVALD